MLMLTFEKSMLMWAFFLQAGSEADIGLTAIDLAANSFPGIMDNYFGNTVAAFKVTVPVNGELATIPEHTFRPPRHQALVVFSKLSLRICQLLTIEAYTSFLCKPTLQQDSMLSRKEASSLRGSAVFHLMTTKACTSFLFKPAQ